MPKPKPRDKPNKLKMNVETGKLATQLIELANDLKNDLPEEYHQRYWDRIFDKLCELTNRKKPEPVPPNKVPMTNDESRKWGQLTKMPFGKYQGERIDSVPVRYLRMISQPDQFRMDLARYMESERVAKGERDDEEDESPF